ncbi:hypothetical protein STIAU_7170 [Stigmatella aurantiaca DW4/3-1]|uniref:Uncharacterized protein n=1 Tax=Stigmatella aurantiaca (strain DW4/3-1) TaxID=378806 RepID=Q08SC1_STIAD|nr:hypothetical protein STIAU_7170 [Stigmatella aurantiaca DW4/3-1]
MSRIDGFSRLKGLSSERPAGGIVGSFSRSGGRPARGGAWSDVGQPLGVAGFLAADDPEVGVLDELGNGARLAFAHRAVVHLAHRGDLRGGAGEEDLVADVERVAGEGDFLHAAATVADELEHRVAGDAIEDGRGEGRGLDDALLVHHEDVLAGGLGHEAADVQQDGLVIAAQHRLALGEDGVDVLAGDLPAHHVDVDVHAGEGADLGADALAHALVTQVCAPVPGGDDDAGGVDRAQAHGAVTHEGDGPQVGAVGEEIPLLAQQLQARLHELIGRERHLQHADVRRVHQPLDVLAQAEHRQAAVMRPVSADALEDAQAVMQRVRHHVHVALVPFHEFAVDPDLISAQYGGRRRTHRAILGFLEEGMGRLALFHMPWGPSKQEISWGRVQACAISDRWALAFSISPSYLRTRFSVESTRSLLSDSALSNARLWAQSRVSLIDGAFLRSSVRRAATASTTCSASVWATCGNRARTIRNSRSRSGKSMCRCRQRRFNASDSSRALFEVRMTRGMCLARKVPNSGMVTALSESTSSRNASNSGSALSISSTSSRAGCSDSWALRMGRGSRKRSEKKTASPEASRSAASANVPVPDTISPILSFRSWV